MAADEKMMAFHAFFTISTQLYHNYGGSTQKRYWEGLSGRSADLPGRHLKKSGIHTPVDKMPRHRAAGHQTESLIV
jgi:hypothetical protein